MMKRSIGIFDSGVGGLTVLKSIIKTLPSENTIYLGDTARVPYGTKSSLIVTQYSLEIGNFLKTENIKALVVACNTASAFALPTLKETFSVPVVGMIEPAAKKAVAATKNGHVGVIGTEGTIRSGAYKEAIKKLDGNITVSGKPCPLFVPLAEEGWVDNDISHLAAKTYLEDLKKSDVDTLILGCTHYPLLKETIKDIMGEKVTLIDSGEEASFELEHLLDERNELEGEGEAIRKYHVTDTPDRFLHLGERFLGEKIDEVVHVDIP